MGKVVCCNFLDTCGLSIFTTTVEYKVWEVISGFDECNDLNLLDLKEGTTKLSCGTAKKIGLALMRVGILALSYNTLIRVTNSVDVTIFDK